MSLVSDVFLLGFFAFFLFSVLRFKPGYFKCYPLSLKRISAGLLILVIIFAYKIGGALWGLIPDTYFKASVWCGLVLGGGHVIWGLCHLFSLGSRSQSHYLHRIRQLVCLKAISSVPSPVKSYEQVLKESLSKLMDIMKYRIGVVFKPSFNSHEMVLVGYWGVPAERIRVLPSLPDENRFYKEAVMNREVIAYDDVTALPEFKSLFTNEDKIRSFAAVPLKFGQKNLGVIGLYDTSPRRFVYQETLFLSSLGRILGTMAEETLVSKRNKWRREYICVVDKVSSIFQAGKHIEEAFPQMAKLLRKVIEFDYLALAVTDPSAENMNHFSVGTGGNILLSKEYSLPTRGSAVLKAMESAKPLIHRDIEYGKFVEDNLLKAIGVRSRLILPLSRYGALTLGSVKIGQYMPKDAKWLNLMGSVLSNALLNYEMTEKTRRTDNLLLKFREISERTMREKQTQKALSHMAREITNELPASFCRISLVQRDRDNLNTFALEKIREQGIGTKEEKTHPLSRLPWHRMVLQTGKTMLINQEDPESLMPDEECEEIMSKELRSGLLVPIIMDQNPVGVLSVGEMRSWNRRPFRQEEVAFLNGLANQIPLLLDRDLKSLSPDTETSRQEEQELNQLGFEINSSLSAIYGSVELMKRKKKGGDEEASRYLDLIQKGGQRIQQAFRQYFNPHLQKSQTGQTELEKEKVKV